MTNTPSADRYHNGGDDQDEDDRSLLPAGAATRQRRPPTSRFPSRWFVFSVAMLCALVISWHALNIPSRPMVRRHLSNFYSMVSTPAQTASERSRLTLAFFLQISGSTMGHTPRLLRKIYEPFNVYAIHIDRKVNATEVAALKKTLFDENPSYETNVFFMESELITYRGISMLLNTINGMQYLLEKNPNWDFFINLSGSDYPLITPEMQRSFLDKGRPSDNYFSMAPKNRWKDNIEYRYAHFYVDEALSFTNGTTKMVRINTRNPISQKHHFTYANSEAWMINSREFVKYVTSSAVARKLLVTFAFSVESSEHYFSTLAYNSRFNGTIVHCSMRSVLWFWKGVHAGQHPLYVDHYVNGTFPYKDAIDASPKFYIRKFKYPESPLMDYIDSRMEDRNHISEIEKHVKWLRADAARRTKEQPAKMPFD